LIFVKTELLKHQNLIFTIFKNGMGILSKAIMLGGIFVLLFGVFSIILE
tara:strand:- start:1025 stop:1171 length:147 start_codon:yes stop_codon:yes gene_type:complete